MNFKKTMMILALGAAIIVSCKKKDDPAPVAAAPATKTSLLTGKNWKMTATTSTVGSATIDGYALMDACEKDDIIVFSAASATALSGTVTIDVKTKCDPSETNETGTWAFNADQTEIISDGLSGKIVELTAKTFKFSYIITDPDIGTITTVTTLTAQ